MSFNHLTTLNKLLISVFQNLPPAKKVAVFFSGGIDSSTIAFYAKRFYPQVLLLYLTTTYSNADKLALKSAKFLKLPILKINLSKKRLTQTLPQVQKLLTDLKLDHTYLNLSLALSSLVLSQEAKGQKISIALTGQGADELFAGYAKFRSEKNLKSKILSEYQRAQRTDAIRDTKAASLEKVNLYSPFMDPTISQFAFSLPQSLLLSKTQNKIILRNLAQKNNFPKFLVSQKKHALQYSTGVQKLLKKHLN